MIKKILLTLGLTSVASTLSAALLVYEGFGGYTADNR